MKKTRAIAPLLDFRVFVCPRTNPEYFTVNIHRSHRHLLAWRRERGNTCGAFYQPSNMEAILCIERNGSESYEVSPCLGSLHFYTGNLGLGIIAHECFHAVSHWSHIRGCRPFNDLGIKRKESRVLRLPDSEELCAELMGGLISQIIVHCTEAKAKIGPGFLSPVRERDYYR